MYYSCAIDPNQMFSIIVFVTRTISYSKTQHRLFVKQQCHPYVPIKRMPTDIGQTRQTNSQSLIICQHVNTQTIGWLALGLFC